jgi:hypothetical protein
MTVIGLNQNVVIPSELPTKTTRVMILHLADVVPDEVLGFTMTVTDPAGETVAMHGGEMKIGQSPFPELPGAADIPVDLVISVASYGTYTISVEFREQSGATQGISTELYVMTSPGEREEARRAPAKRAPGHSSRGPRRVRGSRITPDGPGTDRLE